MSASFLNWFYLSVSIFLMVSSFLQYLLLNLENIETLGQIGGRYPAGIYLFKAKNRKTRKRCEIYYKANNKNTRMTSLTSFWCLYYYCWTSFIFSSQVSVFASVSLVVNTVCFGWKVFTLKKHKNLCELRYLRH